MGQNTTIAWTYQPETASLASRPQVIPSPGAGELVIDNRAIGINPVDWKLIHANPLNWQQGHIPGVDGAGIVSAVGDGVDQSWLRKRVAYHAALKFDGSFAAYTIVRAERVMVMPESLSFAFAAALPCPMLTAWQAFEKIPHHHGYSVLIAGLGAVNKLLVQMLVQSGLQVDVLSRSVTDYEARTLGIRTIYRDPSEIKLHYFAIYDANSGSHAASLVPLLKANGHIICIQDRIPAPIDPPFTRTISYHEIALGALHDFGDAEDWQHLMHKGEQLMARVADRKLWVEEPVEFDFTEMPEALKHSEDSKHKTVVVREEFCP
ncbi:alcohol dehydrogenase catalytic domain-containing protein [Parendozoicomonas haliclonae]|uniref:Alcohol dehydrogenase n=1 Tax=Parendozoicomonas haliclonae TaxID=1960125 RepID=A0A1X7AR51_9GAMM|nr:alcohol dehydrogenase catalytic domain-containing protein [Parendozoicomonas haliclonae]SMA50715.1 Alcohol dehydrogenase [Parendozoicomonas haliclonae]